MSINSINPGKKSRKLASGKNVHINQNVKIPLKDHSALCDTITSLRNEEKFSKEKGFREMTPLRYDTKYMLKAFLAEKKLFL